ncbi:MAG: DUF971 domain-containing protein [SAR202 cluster bacterium]|nr:DUF971 domain-containing protein [SAR202 cluster bacterium]
MENQPRPKEVDIGGANIIILWDDGHRSPYPHRYLRLRCRCASCVEEMTGRPRLDPNKVPQNVRAVDHMPVGNYGIQFLWSDTHYTGIYPFTLLRALCTCIACKEAQAAAERG